MYQNELCPKLEDNASQIKNLALEFNIAKYTHIASAQVYCGI